MSTPHPMQGPASPAFVLIVCVVGQGSATDNITIYSFWSNAAAQAAENFIKGALGAAVTCTIITDSP